MEIRGHRKFGRALQRIVWIGRRAVFGAPAHPVDRAGPAQRVCHLCGGDFALVPVFCGVYFLQGGIDLRGAWPYLLGGALGGLLSGKIFRRVPMVWLRRAFGLLILYGGIRAVLAL